METNAFSKFLAAIILSLGLISCGSENRDSRVTIGFGDTIIIENDLQYHQPVVVQVTDLNGAPQANTLVTFKLRTISFRKGTYTFTRDSDGDGNADQWQSNTSVTCPAEDINNNAMLDLGEDTNNNELLDPDTASISEHPSESPTLLGGTKTLITDSSGFGFITIVYPRSEAVWVTSELTAAADDGLPENIDRQTFRHPILIADISDAKNDPPGGVNSPYGISGVCTDTL